MSFADAITSKLRQLSGKDGKSSEDGRSGSVRRTKKSESEITREKNLKNKATTAKKSAEKSAVDPPNGPKKSTPTKETENDCESAWKCKVCEQTFDGADDKIMECEVCCTHYCIQCIEMPTPVYEYYVAKENKVFWCCEACCPSVRSSVNSGGKNKDRHHALTEAQARKNDAEPDTTETQVKETIGEMKELMEDFRAMMGMTQKEETDPPKANTTPQTEGHDGDEEHEEEQHGGGWKTVMERGKAKNLKDLIKECSKESEDEKRRKKNIIVHRFPEMKSDRFEERRHYDEGFANTLVKEVLLVDVDIVEVRRLGRKNNKKN
jgi:hypothetical protein